MVNKKQKTLALEVVDHVEEILRMAMKHTNEANQENSLGHGIFSVHWALLDCGYCLDSLREGVCSVETTLP